MVKFFFICCLTAILLGGAQVTPLSDLDAALKKYIDVLSANATSKLFGLDNTLIVRQLFNLFKTEFKRIYTTVNEERVRFVTFQKTLETILRIDVQQRGKSPFTIGLNKFSDWTTSELDALNGYEPFGDDNKNIPELNDSLSFAHSNGKVFNSKSSYSNVPSTFDYTTRVITGTTTAVLRPIKNQGAQCGSCWAFAFVSLLEYQFAIQLKFSRDLSEQQFVDCSTENHGCNGGYFESSMKYLIDNQLRVDSTSAYPYRGYVQTCRVTNTNGVQFGGLKQWAIKTDIVAQMQYRLVNYGPLYVTIYVGGKKYSKSLKSNQSSIDADAIEVAFHGYKKGVLNIPSCANWQYSTNHAMVLVGYGIDTESGLPYWKLRNSWGNVGDQGYWRVRRGVNYCGIESGAFYITKL